MDLLNLFNWGAFIVFIISIVLIAGKLLSRFINFIRFNLPVPILLKRDLFLFWSIVIYTGSGLLALATGTTNLAKDPLWVIPRGTLILAALIYWAYVEYNIEDSADRKKK